MNLKIGALLVGGLAAYAYYRYSKMSESERAEMVNGLKEKGKKIINDYFPNGLKDELGKKFSTE